MLKSLRTYRIIPSLVVAALVLAIGTPLVQYACGMSGTSVVMASTLPDPACAKSGQSTAEAEYSCHSDTASAALCPDADLCGSMGHCAAQDARADVRACCSQQSLELEDSATPDANRAADLLVLPLSSFLSDAAVVAQERPHFFPQPASDRASHAQIPLRVLFSSFLI